MGWPIATGVIEGACRYLVKDRIAITGARWSLPGAEAVLLLRAVIINGDFDAYWKLPSPARTPTHPHQPLPAPIRPGSLTKIEKVTQSRNAPPGVRLLGA